MSRQPFRAGNYRMGRCKRSREETSNIQKLAKKLYWELMEACPQRRESRTAGKGKKEIVKRVGEERGRANFPY